MGNQCCSQSDQKHQLAQTNAPSKYDDDANDNEQVKRHKVQVHTKQDDDNERLESIDNMIKVEDSKFRRELKSLQEALQKANAFKDIVENTKKLTKAIYELEHIVNYLSKTATIPLHVLNIKSDLLGLYGDLQNFRSFHSRFTLENSFYEHLPAITSLLNFIKNLIAQNPQYNENGLINYQKLVFDLNNNKQFDEQYNKIKLLRSSQNEISGTNFSILPNYLYCTLKDKKGFELWEKILPYQFEVSNEQFVQAYINETYSPSVKQKILDLLVSMDLNNDQRIDIYQFLQIVEDFSEFFDNDGKIINNKLDELANKVKFQKIPPQKQVNKENIYVYQTGMEYEGQLDEKGQRKGHGKLRDEEYEFEGEFVNDLPHGNGTEVRKKVKYVGEFQKGLYHGKGVLTFPNGRSYNGSFANHQFHGQGVLVGDDGITYKGDWKNGQLLEGVITYHDQSYYIGNLQSNFFKSGKGQFYNADQYTIFEGEWYQDKPNNGKLFSVDDGVTLVYQGGMYNYNIEGRGTRFYSDGSVYEGELLRDKKCEQGQITYKDQSMFVGTWENDFQVNGTYYYNKNNQNNFYKGQWENGIQNGKGLYQYPSGGVYEGEVKNSKRHGYGTYKYSNGNVYEGQWEDNNQSGEGKFTFAVDGQQGQGDQYYGQFEKGKFSGFGIYIYKKSNKQYIGFWKNDMWEGHGKFINNDGTLVKCGIWKNDKLETPQDEKDIVFPKDWERFKTHLNITEQKKH